MFTQFSRVMYRFVRKPSSSLNITVPELRLPYSRVTRLAGSVASIDLTSDSTGVMQAPAQMNM